VTTKHILIAGAGIGGLTPACALQQRGFRVTVLEQASKLTELGAGVQISANGARALLSLGLGDALQQVWSEPTGKEVRLWNSGRTWKLFDLGTVSRERYGAPYFMVHRADLHRCLRDAVHAADLGAVRFGARCLRADQDAAGVRVTLSDGEVVTGDALIGADGVHSVIRNQLVGETQANFTGCVAWRGLVRGNDMPEHMRRPVGTNWIGPGGHVVHYPLRGGELFNFIGVVERDDWRVESWNAEGTTAECLADFPGWHEDVHFLIEHMGIPYKWALLGREPLQRWTHGCITLPGDAAHPTLPMMAQGANMAIEDGIVLARCLSAKAGDISAGLLAYERARRERTGRLVRAANDNAKRFHNPILRTSEGAEQYVSTEWQEAKIKQRYDWVFEYDALTAAI
jgi:salicylate hydroxylase